MINSCGNTRQRRGAERPPWQTTKGDVESKHPDLIAAPSDDSGALPAAADPGAAVRAEAMHPDEHLMSASANQVDLWIRSVVCDAQRREHLTELVAELRDHATGK